jgi:FlaA1/EpsC-like NDP-sugar epimerase
MRGGASTGPCTAAGLARSKLCVEGLSAVFRTLWVCRIYKRSWWRGSIGDFHRVGKATLIVATLIVEVAAVLLIIGLYRFQGFSRLVFVLDAIFSWSLLVAIRASFRLSWRNATA